jgi:CopG family transcriptional regulator/antitoxin EndoAI
MHRRINITLPDETVNLIDRVAEKGNRSRLIDQAVRHYVSRMGRARLRRLLKEQAIRRVEDDRRLAAQWFSLAEEAWRKPGR